MQVNYLRTTALIFATCASACSDSLPARVRIESGSQLAPEIILGANAWHLAGLTAGEDGEATIRVELVGGLRNTDGNKVNGTTDRERGVIRIEARLSGRQLQHVMAHEVGHAVFRCDHLEHGVGIMSHVPVEPWVIEPTEADYALACDAGYCR